MQLNRQKDPEEIRGFLLPELKYFDDLFVSNLVSNRFLPKKRSQKYSLTP